jgi:hypothetical protein
MIFKVNRKSFGQVKRNMVDDISVQLLAEMKDILEDNKSYYSEISDSFEIEKIPCGNTIGSERWAAAAIDVGGDWGTWFPNLDNITKWIIKHKDPQKFGRENPEVKWKDQPNKQLKKEALNVARDIERTGFKSSIYYVDDAIRTFSGNFIDLI